VTASSGVTFAALDGRPAGHATYCSDCKADVANGNCAASGSGAFAFRVGSTWKCGGAEATLEGTQTLKNKTLDGSTTFPSGVTLDTEWDTVAEVNAHLSDGPFATTTGTESLTHKDLTATTNTFPGLGVLTFHGSGPGGTGTTYFGPGGPVSATEGDVQSFVPGITVKAIRCRANSTGLLPGKRWDIYLRKGGSDASSACTLNSNPASCSITPNVSYNGSSEVLNLRVTATGGPTSVAVDCTASLGF